MSDTQNTETGAETAKVRKSIVPAKYAGRYKEDIDELSKFIADQCKGEGGSLDYNKFFELCAVNGLPKEKVDHYAQQVADKRLGSQGRARMTLRNMLATIARKDGKLRDLDGDTVDIHLEKVVAQSKKAAE